MSRERKASRPTGLEFKAVDAAPTSVRLARDGRWALTCSLCGLPSGLADRPLPNGARLVCLACVEAGAPHRPARRTGLGRRDVPDPGLLTVADQAMAEEIEF